MDLHAIFAHMGRTGSRNAADYETAVATWYDDGKGDPPTLAACEAAWAELEAERPWNEYRQARDTMFNHWNSYVPGMLALQYGPAVAIFAEIQAGYGEVLNMPADPAHTPETATARLHELDAWLSTAVGRSSAFV